MTENQETHLYESQAGPASRWQQFRATPEAEARLLLLIDGFSRKTTGPRTLEGRVKLAKLDFLLRYPHHLARVLERRNVDSRTRTEVVDIEDAAPIDSRMMRYRYGPWDPAYYALLGALIGRRLIQALPLSGSSGFGYRTTAEGERVTANLAADDCFGELNARIRILRRHLDLSGTALKNLLYDLPEVADATWKEDIQ
ncbi:hypothetical protein [Arthrobacter sp. UYCu723]